MRYIVLITMMMVATLFARGQTQAELPVGSDLFSVNIFEAPDGMLWSGKAGKYVCIGSRSDYMALINAGYTNAQVDSIAQDVYDRARDRANHEGTQDIETVTGLQDALNNKEDISNRRADISSPNNLTYPTTQAVADYVAANQHGLEEVLSVGNDGGNNSITNISTITANQQMRSTGGANITSWPSNSGQIAVSRNNSEPFISFHDNEGNRIAHVQGGQGVGDTLRLWNHGTNTSFYTDNSVIKRLDIDRHGIFTENHGQSSYWDRSTKYPVVQNEKRKATFAFIFDDGNESDDVVANRFEEEGWRVGFALITGGSYTSWQTRRYLRLQRQGHEILSHSVSNQRFNASTTLSPGQARHEFRNSLDSLKKWGFNVTGWVTPYSEMRDDFIDILQEYYGYGFTKYFGTVNENNVNLSYHNYNQDLNRLWRVSLESSNEVDIISAIDSCVAYGGMMVFYAHSYPSTTIPENKLTAVIDHLKSYTQTRLAEVLLPVDAVRKYYAFNSSDRIDLNKSIDSKLSKDTGGKVSSPVTIKGGLAIERSNLESQQLGISYEGGQATIQLNNGLNSVFSDFIVRGVNSLNNNLVYTRINNVGITANQYRLTNLNVTPLSSTAPGTTGEIRITSTHIYVCIATNTWVRTELTSW